MKSIGESALNCFETYKHELSVIQDRLNVIQELLKDESPIFLAPSGSAMRAVEQLCQSCGDHILCTAATQSGATWYNWNQLNGPISLGSPQGSKTMRLNCTGVGNGFGTVFPYDGNPSNGGERVGPQQSFFGFCSGE
ncbi:MAG: hypothetical protein AAF438_07030 [Pseudomonadota bacterium]